MGSIIKAKAAIEEFEEAVIPMAIAGYMGMEQSPEMKARLDKARAELEELLGCYDEI